MADRAKVYKLCMKIAKKTLSDSAFKTLCKDPEKNPTIYGLTEILTDDMVDVAMCMKVRKGYLAEDLAPKAKMPVAKVQKLLDEMADIGFIEFDWENEDHHKQYVLPIFILGNVESMIKNPKLIREHPELGNLMYDLGLEPLKKAAHMVPPGGGGLALRVIPIEKAIPVKNECVDVERISYWLDKYEGHYAITPCECRKAMEIRGEGSGDMAEGCCMLFGDYAEYLIETNKGKRATREEIMETIQRCEENGYMHCVANVDGEHKSIGLCNCNMSSCMCLRMSQLFNTPNAGSSCYRAYVDKSKCVACGKCVEVCVSGAAKLGQKLCTKQGEVQYPKQELPDDVKWDESKWNPNYRNDNMKNTHLTGTAPCKTACPAHIAVQGYIRMAAEGRYDEALELIKQDNPLPAICGSICNHRCEQACTRGSIDEPVAIDAIKRFIAERELKKEHRFIPVRKMHKGSAEPYTEKIAVIGSGPAGLSCAYYLSNMGYDNVTVFEKEKTIGGMLMNGIPSFRLEKDIVKAEIEVIKEMGVTFKTGIEVGKDVTLKELREEGYRAFYVAIGCQGGRMVNVSGEDAEGIISGIDFLRNINADSMIELDGDTVVIGGGNVAIDVARSARRAGDGNISMFCLESRDTMPASNDEIEAAEEENIQINPGWGPKEILTKDGKVTGIVLKKCLSTLDADGKFHPVYKEEETVTISCKNILLTVGQSIQWGNLLKDSNVVLGRGNSAVADPITYQTAESDIFVGGDVHTGPRFAIDAIAGGREGAISIHRFVQPGQSLTMSRNPRDFYELDKDNVVIPDTSYDKPFRQTPSKIKAEKAVKSFHNPISVLTEDQIKKEASRCLGCGATIVDQNKCIGCGICTTKCKFDAISLRRDHPENAKMVPCEDTVKTMLPYVLKREIKIIKKKFYLADTPHRRNA